MGIGSSQLLKWFIEYKDEKEVDGEEEKYNVEMITIYITNERRTSFRGWGTKKNFFDEMKAGALYSLLFKAEIHLSITNPRINCILVH